MLRIYYTGHTKRKRQYRRCIRFLNENDIVEFEDEVRNDKLSVTTLKLIHRDEESARRFQERRAERRRATEDRKQRAEKSERRSGFAFWKK